MFLLPSRKTGAPGPAWDLHPAAFSKLFRPQAGPVDGQVMARIQPLLLDGILAANTLPGHFEFARTRTAQTAAGMIDLHWTDVSGATLCELWTWCAAAIVATTRRYPEGWQALP